MWKRERNRFGGSSRKRSAYAAPKECTERSNSAARLRPIRWIYSRVLVHMDSFVSTPTLCMTLSLDLTWTAPSSSSQEAPQTRSRGVQVQDGRRNVCEFPPGASPIIRLVTRQTRQRPTHTLQGLSLLGRLHMSAKWSACG